MTYPLYVEVLVAVVPVVMVLFAAGLLALTENKNVKLQPQVSVVVLAIAVITAAIGLVSTIRLSLPRLVALLDYLQL